MVETKKILLNSRWLFAAVSAVLISPQITGATVFTNTRPEIAQMAGL
jgi:hypothetical protein